MNLNPNREYRSFAEFGENSEDDARLVLRGTPVVFDTPTCLFECDGVKYFEVIDRGAFAGCDFSDFIFNYNHGGRVYARNRNKTLEYEIHQNAMNCTAYLMADDEGHRQLYRDIQTGLIDKMSFSFTVSEVSYDKETRTRKILKIKKLYDVSAVDIPAYNETGISARRLFSEAYGESVAAQDFETRRKILLAKTYLF